MPSVAVPRRTKRHRPFTRRIASGSVGLQVHSIDTDSRRSRRLASTENRRRSKKSTIHRDGARPGLSVLRLNNSHLEQTEATGVYMLRRPASLFLPGEAFQKEIKHARRFTIR